ncbi:hypothetical protein [Pseudonocardia sp. N23]|uniref:thiolase C-terminal domain-containing protein n=1 Tax=Pseudonocardia sp. N23 TaxID=1987376 RepID=UPI000BFDE6B2|nr:hypothetical protein [Pseudonocardia sp. N23]GAY12158.1 hypothetical protein TOK_0548 [Pseudonocardia sp. N23]
MTWANRCVVAVAGVGFSAVERRTSTPLGRFADDAAAAAIADAGLTPDAVDGLATYPTPPFEGAVARSGEDMVDVEHFLQAPWARDVGWYSQAGEGMVTTSVRDAVHALAAGACTTALVWRAMYVPPGTYGTHSTAAAGDAAFAAPYGCAGAIPWHALAYRRYLELSGGRREAMAALVVGSRNNANRNPHAVFAGRTMTEQDYLGARMIADPLCLFDCDVPVTAAIALVLTTAERAHDLPRPPVFVAAAAQQTTRREHRLHYTMGDHVAAGTPLVDDLWRQSGLGVGDVGVAQLYDGFAPSVLYWLEAAGFCGRGEALDFVQDGRIAVDGALPVNTGGGSLSQGRMHGMGHLAEAVLQLRRDAGARQVADPRAALVLVGSPMLRGGGVLLTTEQL